MLKHQGMMLAVQLQEASDEAAQSWAGRRTLGAPQENTSGGSKES